MIAVVFLGCIIVGGLIAVIVINHGGGIRGGRVFFADTPHAA